MDKDFKSLENFLKYELKISEEDFFGFSRLLSQNKTICSFTIYGKLFIIFDNKTVLYDRKKYKFDTFINIKNFLTYYKKFNDLNFKFITKGEV